MFDGPFSEQEYGEVTMNEALTALLTLLTGIYAFLTSRILRANEAVVSAMRAEHEAAGTDRTLGLTLTTRGTRTAS